MKTTLLIQLHEKGLHILELIEYADKRKLFYLENINGFAGQFPNLKQQYQRKAENITAVKLRLYSYYQNTLNRINKIA